MEKEQLLRINEDRRHEFKSGMPTNSDLAKTVCAFANDAGGEIFIDVDDNKNVIGLDEDELPRYEEKISNMIYDRCYPYILPEISFLNVDEKHLLRVKIYRGSMPPYYLKDEGKLKGTYIRVGANNRVADESLVAELERKRRNISFDSEIVMEKKAEELNISGFKELFKEKTDEELTHQILRKLELVKEEQGAEYPTNALVLLSDDALRTSLFPNATIECARFKGTTADEFIDQKHIGCNIAMQTEEAYNFVLKHINKGAKVNGVYTVSRWEYPIKAIREVIRNAVVHRQYSLTGKDIKVAIYDDMVEITSPGLLPPSIDYSNMRSRQSDARNRILAPVFKQMGLIDKWGNGLLLIDDEMKAYPNIEFRWKEIGMSFQIQFAKRDGDVTNVTSLTQNVTSLEGNVISLGEDDASDVISLDENVTSLDGNGVSDVISLEGDVISLMQSVLKLVSEDTKISTTEIAKRLDISKRQCQRMIAKLKKEGYIEREGITSAGHWVVLKTKSIDNQ